MTESVKVLPFETLFLEIRGIETPPVVLWVAFQVLVDGTESFVFVVQWGTFFTRMERTQSSSLCSPWVKPGVLPPPPPCGDRPGEGLRGGCRLMEA